MEILGEDEGRTMAHGKRKRRRLGSRSVLGVEPDAFARRIRRGEKLADGIKDNFELLVVVVFENTDLASQFLDRESHLADANEGAHDADVDGHGTRTVENAGKHGDAFLSERIGQIPAATPSFV